MGAIMNFTRKKIVIVSSVAAATLSMGYYFFYVIPNGELGQKETWSVLQGAEIQHRGDTDSQSPKFLAHALDSEYNLLGIPTDDHQSPRAWLILNKNNDDNKIDVLPEKKTLVLECSYVDELQSKTKIEPAALSFLLGICKR